jgi:hypothetical protein
VPPPTLIYRPNSHVDLSRRRQPSRQGTERKGWCTAADMRECFCSRMQASIVAYDKSYHRLLTCTRRPLPYRAVLHADASLSSVQQSSTVGTLTDCHGVNGCSSTCVGWRLGTRAEWTAAHLQVRECLQHRPVGLGCQL